jgi:hypothetical protein
MTQAGSVFVVDPFNNDCKNELNPDVIYIKAVDEYLVVWRRRVQENQYATYGGLVNAKTHSQHSNFQISSQSSAKYENQKIVGHVAVTYNNIQNIALVVWSESSPPGPRTGNIYGRFIEPDGKMTSPPFRITNSSNSIYDPQLKLSWNSKTNLYLVMWEGPNQQGCKMPYSAIIDASGNVSNITIVGEPSSKTMINYSLHSVVANSITGQWLATYDKYCRIIEKDGSLVSTPITFKSITDIYDAFITPSCYYLVGTSWIQNKTQLWSATLSFDGKNFSNPKSILFTESVVHARVAYNPALQFFLVFYSHVYSTNVNTVFWCNKLDLNGDCIDNKPTIVIRSGDYNPVYGYASCAVNSSNTETLVVWPYKSEVKKLYGGTPPPPEEREHYSELRGKIVDIEEGLIVVRDEFNEPLTDAEVWINGAFAGHTGVSGCLRHGVKLGDKIIAKKLVYEHSSNKDGHYTAGTPYGNWDFHVWLTSAIITEEDLEHSTDIYHEVFDPLQPQELIIRKDNTLIGFNLVVYTEFDTFFEIDNIKNVLTKASNRIYYATDGQFFLEHIRIEGEKLESSARALADMYIYSGAGTPQTFRSSETGNVIFMYTWFEDHVPHEGDHAHELLHYYCHLEDESELRGKVRFALCTERYLKDTSGVYASGGKKSSCPMAWAGNYGPYKLCTKLPDNPHNSKIMPQGAESCWDSLYKLFMETPSIGEANGRWQLIHPKFRGKIIEGPSRIPVDAWSTVE